MRLSEAYWLHFIIIGSVLFALVRYFEPLPPIPYPQDSEIAELQENWLRTTGGITNDTELVLLIKDWQDQELLFQEALRLKLYLDDTLVWRRLIRNMRFVGAEGDDIDLLQQALKLGTHTIDPVVRRRLLQRMRDRMRSTLLLPLEATLQTIYQQRLVADYTLIRRSFQHIYFAYDRRGRSGAKSDAQSLKCTADLFLATEQRTGDAYPAAPLNIVLSTEQQIIKRFGANFASAVMAAVVEHCFGPVESAYGMHWIYVTEHKVEPRPYQSVRALLLENWLRKQTDNALNDLVTDLRSTYSGL